MLDLVRRTPAAAEQITFADGAPKLHANGYFCLPMRSGAKAPSVQLSAAAAFLHPDLISNPGYGEGIAVLCSAIPHSQLSFERAQASWLVGVQVLMSSKKIAASVDDFINARFPNVAIRLTTGTHDRLYIFGLSREPLSNGRPHLPFEPSRSQRWWQMPKNGGTEEYERVKVLCGNEWFAYSGHCGERITGSRTDPDHAFYWRESRDLMEVSSASLPTLDPESAAQLRLDIEQIFEAHGAERVL